MSNKSCNTFFSPYIPNFDCFISASGHEVVFNIRGCYYLLLFFRLFFIIMFDCFSLCNQVLLHLCNSFFGCKFNGFFANRLFNFIFLVQLLFLFAIALLYILFVYVATTSILRLLNSTRSVQRCPGNTVDLVVVLVKRGHDAALRGSLAVKDLVGVPDNDRLVATGACK